MEVEARAKKEEGCNMVAKRRCNDERHWHNGKRTKGTIGFAYQQQQREPHHTKDTATTTTTITADTNHYYEGKDQLHYSEAKKGG
jgi:hypothetical protein